MHPFEYSNPSTTQEAVGLLGAKWGEADVLAGGTDLISLMKEHLATPNRLVNIKNIKNRWLNSEFREAFFVVAYISLK